MATTAARAIAALARVGFTFSRATRVGIVGSGAAAFIFAATLAGVACGARDHALCALQHRSRAALRDALSVLQHRAFAARHAVAR
jgi:non-ribosomal peptide synthetase component F